MKTLYTLKTTVWNGTVPIQSLTDAFLDKELAERTLKVMEEENKYCAYRTTTKLEEIPLFETESEVSILREIDEKNTHLNGNNTQEEN